MARFLEALGNTAIIGAIVLVLASLGSRAARNSSATLRYAIWMTAFAVMIVAPFARPLRSLVESGEEELWARAGRTVRVGSSQVPAPTADAPSSQMRVDAQPASSGSWLPILAVVWIAGTLIVSARALAGINVARRIIRGASTHGDSEWQRITDDLARKLEIKRHVAVVFSDTASMPATWGTLRPVVLLPNSAQTWDAGLRESVLLHELTHVARFDVLTQLLVEAACAVFWFNPLVWWASARLRSEREKACDSNVVTSGVDRYQYADDLIRVAKSTRPCGTPLLATFSNAKEFESRVRALLMNKARATMMSTLRGFVWGGSLAVLAVAAIGMRPLSMARIQTQLVRIGNGYGTQVEYPVDREDAWTQEISPGRWLEIFNPAGDVVVTRATDTVASVRVYGAGSNRWRVIRGDSGDVQHCIVSKDSGDDCALYPAGQISSTRIVVALPRGVRLAIHARKGNVDVSGATERVWVRADTGDIRVQTDGAAGARTREGNVHVVMGATLWSDVTEITSQHGDAEVMVSRNINAALRVHGGRIASAISLDRVSSDPPQARRAELGVGPYGVLKVFAGGSVRLGLLP